MKYDHSLVAKHDRLEALAILAVITPVPSFSPDRGFFILM
jgi:hypothetical protein